MSNSHNIEFLIEDIILFHSMMENAEGIVVTSGIRDRGLLESAVNAPFQSMFGEDLYPEDVDKAAKLLYGLVKNHGFVDGNKRVAAHAMVTFLAVVDIELKYEQMELVNLVEDVAKSTEQTLIACNKIRGWILKHII